MIKNVFVRQYMLKNGANPFIVGCDQSTEAAREKLRTSDLHMPKSIYHRIVPFFCACDQLPCSNPFPGQYYYRNGVFGYKFIRVIGRGGESTVIESEICGKKVAFKYVKVKKQEPYTFAQDAQDALLKRLNEMGHYWTIKSDLIVQFHGHFQ